ncbi:MAG: hypothetical protein REV36_02625 [Burkholderia sp.]|nr:hypothetical protein [Burkholderia sp.]
MLANIRATCNAQVYPAITLCMSQYSSYVDLHPDYLRSYQSLYRFIVQRSTVLFTLISISDPIDTPLQKWGILIQVPT